MAITTRQQGRVDLSEHGLETSGRVRRNPTTSHALHARARARRGPARRGRPARRRHRPAHRPLAEGQVRRPRAGLRGPDLVGRRQRRLDEDRFDGLAREGRRAPRRAATSTSSTRSPAPTRRTGSPSGWSPTTPTTRSSRRRCSSTRPRTSCATSSRRRSSCTPRRSRPTPRRTARAPAPSSCCTRRAAEVLIGGTFYAGEIKKSIFTLMNDRLPLEGVFPMHCSANVGDDGDVARLLRPLRHGQDDALGRSRAPPDRRRRARLGRRRRLQLRGRLLREGDPPLRGGRARDLQDDAHVRDGPRERRRRRARRASTSTTTRRPRTRAPRTSSSRSRTRCRRSAPATRGQVVFLTADAFGILPPIARLTREQAMFYFLSGFTAKLAGTEIGVTEPQPTFSACFGAPFLPQPPVGLRAAARREARRARRERSGSSTRAGPAGPYGEGHRMPIDGDPRRSCARRSRGELDEVEYRTDALFGFEVPVRGAGRRLEAARPALDVARPRAPTTRRRASSRGCSATTSRSSTPTPDIAAAGPRV